MKQFFKMTLATICGIVIFTLIMGFFLVISVVGMIASDSASTKVKDNSVFVVKLDGAISERSEGSSVYSELMNMGDMGSVGLDDAKPRTMRTSKVSTSKVDRCPSMHLLQPSSCAMP